MLIKRMSTCVFRAYDWCYLRYYRLNRESARAGNLILFHFIRHRGNAITLSDGTCVGRGDPIVVIHVNKLRAREMQTLAGHTAFAGVKLRADFRNSLRLLAWKIRDNPIYREVRAIRGNTIHGPAARYFGFDARPDIDMETLKHRLGLANAATLIASARKARTRKTNEVDLEDRTLWTIWMSQKTLMSRYPPPTA